MAPFLRAVLEDTTVAPNGVHHLTPFANADCQGFLVVHILASLRRLDGVNRMPVTRGHNHHRVDVLTGDELAEILVRGAALVALESVHQLLALRLAAATAPLSPRVEEATNVGAASITPPAVRRLRNPRRETNASERRPFEVDWSGLSDTIILEFLSRNPPLLILLAKADS